MAPAWVNCKHISRQVELHTKSANTAKGPGSDYVRGAVHGLLPFFFVISAHASWMWSLAQVSQQRETWGTRPRLAPKNQRSEDRRRYIMGANLGHRAGKSKQAWKEYRVTRAGLEYGYRLISEGKDGNEG